MHWYHADALTSVLVCAHDHVCAHDNGNTKYVGVLIPEKNPIKPNWRLTWAVFCLQYVLLANLTELRMMSSRQVALKT